MTRNKHETFVKTAAEKECVKTDSDVDVHRSSVAGRSARYVTPDLSYCRGRVLEK